MNVQDIYLLCFAVGALWSFAALLLGRIHAGNFGHSHIGHSHAGQAGHVRTGRGAPRRSAHRWWRFCGPAAGSKPPNNSAQPTSGRTTRV